MHLQKCLLTQTEEKKKIEDGADTNKYPVRVFASLTATIALKTLSKRRRAKDLCPGTDAHSR